MPYINDDAFNFEKQLEDTEMAGTKDEWDKANQKVWDNIDNGVDGLVMVGNKHEMGCHRDDYLQNALSAKKGASSHGLMGIGEHRIKNVLDGKVVITPISVPSKKCGNPITTASQDLMDEIINDITMLSAKMELFIDMVNSK